MHNTDTAQFNFAPLSYIHDSWLIDLPDGDLLIKLRGCRRAQLKLSRYILRQNGINGHFCADFSGPLERLALLDSELIEKWVLYLGVALNALHVQQTVARSELLAIKQSIGEPAYQFSLKRAPHLGEPPPELLTERSFSGNFSRHAIACGARALRHAYSRCEPALFKRLQLKLPLSWWEQTLDAEAASEVAPQAADHAAAFCERVAIELELL